MVLDVCGRGDARSQFGNIGRAAHLVEGVIGSQLLDDGKHVYGLLCRGQSLYSFVDHLVLGLVETLGLEEVADGGISILFEHHGAQYGLFEFFVSRHYASCRVFGAAVVTIAAVSTLAISFFVVVHCVCFA